MKKFRFIMMASLAVIFLFAVSHCSEDDPVTLYSISGKVTYPDFNGSNADAGGAVVYLGETAGSMTFVASAITASNGTYTLKDLQPNKTYYVWATYDSKNTNLPEARVDRVIFTGDQVEVLLDGNKTADIALGNSGQDNALAISTADGGNYRADLTHSMLDFEFDYDKQTGTDDYNAKFTGKFGSFGVEVDFDPAALGSSSITADVDLLSVYTRTPGGRDPLYNSDGTFWQDPNTQDYDLGCISTTFGVVSAQSDTPPAEGDAKRTATFTSSSIEEYGDGYLAKGTLTFAGSTSSVNLFFKFFPGFVNDSGARYASFEGFFTFKALADHGIESSHVNDAEVQVNIFFQVRENI
jgi:polyisoprenoid-binding protein YceI